MALILIYLTHDEQVPVKIVQELNKLKQNTEPAGYDYLMSLLVLYSLSTIKTFK